MYIPYILGNKMTDIFWKGLDVILKEFYPIKEVYRELKISKSGKVRVDKLVSTEFHQR